MIFQISKPAYFRQNSINRFSLQFDVYFVVETVFHRLVIDKNILAMFLNVVEHLFYCRIFGFKDIHPIYLFERNSRRAGISGHRQ